jgi:hypothetical protein
MNEDILKAFDDLPRGSIILNLGDICLNSSVSFNDLRKIIDRMRNNGKHLWILLGNHDRDIMKYISGQYYMTPRDFFMALGFERVYEYPIILNNTYILSHEPIYLKPGTNLCNIHGHTHQFPVDENYFNRDCENWAMMEVVKKHMVSKQKNLDIDTSKKPYNRKVDPTTYQNVCWDYTHRFYQFDFIEDYHF